ncbi:MAG: hypothetical protein JNJ48_00080 [Phycisphaerae bacterium]|nr:hypothetical protein [Phycisphaerae bacterium]
MNVNNGSMLLKRLAGLAPGAGAAAAGAARSIAGGAEAFASMLERAGRGELESGLKVTVSSRCDLTLSESQLSRLSRAADEAEAAGMVTAVAVIDGMALHLDVQARTVTGRLDASQRSAGRVDGVVYAPAEGEHAAAAAVGTPGALAAGMNASVLRLLTGMGAGGGTGAAG